MEYTIENLLTRLDKLKKLNLIHSYVVTEDSFSIGFYNFVGNVVNFMYARSPMDCKNALNALKDLSFKTFTISEKNIYALSCGDTIKLANGDTVVFKGHDLNGRDHARLDMGGHGFNVVTSVPYQMLYGLIAKIDLLACSAPFGKSILQQLREWNK